MGNLHKEPLRIAVYGKGGIGKSFVAANLSVLFARQGRKVVHVGCDPKGDSTRNLAAENPPEPALERLLDYPAVPKSIDELLRTGVEGVACVEAGGPEPGEGCGGMGILKLFQFLARTGFFKSTEYNAQVFDVLGDVVCGGFVAPLRFASPLSVLVVVSEEVHSLYAANQVAKAVHRYANSGAYLAGVVLNRRDNRADIGHVSRFAAALGVPVLAELPRSTGVFDADLEKLPAVVHQPAGELAQCLEGLATTLSSPGPEELPSVTPLTPADFDALLSRVDQS